MKKRSLIALFLATVMLLLSLGSCTPATPDQSTSTNAEEGTESTTKKPLPEEELLQPVLPALPGDPLSEIVAKQQNFEADRTSGAFSFDLSLTYGEEAFADAELYVLLLGSIVTTENKRLSIKESFPLTKGSDSVQIEAAAMEGFRSGLYAFRIFTKEDDLFVGEALRFSLGSGDEFRAYLLTDTHYTGTNEAFAIYNYSQGAYQTDPDGVKDHNNYTAEYDNYGWTSDEKLQRVVDDIIMRYKTGEIHMAFILGDVAMNDGNYRNFAQDHVTYHTGYAYLQNGVLLPPGSSLPTGTPSLSTVTHYGSSILDFWDSPLNVSYMVREKFLKQLSAAGVPYFLANGNHDYQYYYNADKTDLDYTAWENANHYAELFGHKNGSGQYIDATPVDYLVRVIRRDGEFKVLSALSSEELAAFRERNKDDGNCYDFYVSEDSVIASDTLVTAFMMINPHQIDGYDNYMKLYITYDIAQKKYDYWWQTLRASYYPKAVMKEMTPFISDYSNVWMLSHLITATPEFKEFIAENDNVRGSFYGDVHTEEYRASQGGAPAWVVGYYSHSYDIDSYYVRDPKTGELTSTPDNQYYYDRGNPKLANKTWGDTMRHPFNHVILHIQENMAYVEREHQGVYYANDWQELLTYDWVRGKDADYAHATDFTKAAGSSFRDGNRTVYVGGDVATVGNEMAYIGRSYTKNKYNKNEYILKPDNGTSYQVCTPDGNPTGESVTLPSFEEGTSFSYKNETYYILSKIGGVSGHYLYDENGNYVYRTQSGDLVFSDFIRNEAGEIVKEYFYLNDRDEFVDLGEWKNGEYVLKDGIYTDVRLYKSGVDHAKQANGKWSVTSAKIEIENGVIVRGEGFTGFSYARTFVDSYGNPVSESRIVLASSGYGYYAPRESYNGMWIVFN